MYVIQRCTLHKSTNNPQMLPNHRWNILVALCWTLQEKSRLSNSFWDHSLLLQSSSFLYGYFLFCKPPVKPRKLTFSINSTLLVCFVCLWHFLHPARSSTAVRSGSDPGISFPSPFAHPDLIQNLSQAYAQLRLGAYRLHHVQQCSKVRGLSPPSWRAQVLNNKTFP